MATLAIDGGQPIRTTFLPYGRQWVDDADVEAVASILLSDWLTTGPVVQEFERLFAEAVRSNQAVAVSNGTAALHAAIYALGIGPGSEVIVSPMTFAASANCVVYQGGTPVFADVDPNTLLIDPLQAEKRVTAHTRAIIAVDYAGQPCNYDALHMLAETYDLALISDACHALGATYQSRQVGSLADLNAFSLHPVKHITSGEGGIVTTHDAKLAQRMRQFRNHGITTDHRQREEQGSWYYEMDDLGYNYRLTDIQCALGMSQLRKLAVWIARRRDIAHQYDAAFSDMPGIRPLAVRPEVEHAYHLYVIELNLECLTVDRGRIFKALRAEGIGVNVHYIPVHLHPFYRRYLGTGPGLCPVAETAYERILSLPIFPLMTDEDVVDVIQAVDKVLGKYLS